MRDVITRTYPAYPSAVHLDQLLDSSHLAVHLIAVYTDTIINLDDRTRSTDTGGGRKHSVASDEQREHFIARPFHFGPHGTQAKCKTAPSDHLECGGHMLGVRARAVVRSDAEPGNHAAFPSVPRYLD